MAQTTPPTVDPLGTPPTTASPANFDTRADSFLAQLQTWATQLAALGANLYNNAVDAYNNAMAAAASAVAALASQTAAALNASAAAASAGATVWTSGSYSVGTRKYSPTNQRLYKCKTGGAGATDPASDGTNWDLIDTSPVVLPIAGTSATVYAGIAWSLNNAAATAITMDATMPDSGEFTLVLKNGRQDNTLDIGTKTLFGPSGSITGVITLDTQARAIRFKYFATSTSLEIMN